MLRLFSLRRGFAPLLLAPALLAFPSGCQEKGVPDEPLGTPSPPPTRPSDGLLSDVRLQDAVDLQVERDGDGLMELLADPDAVVRARAAFALGSVQDPEAGPALTGRLRDDDPAVRRDAAFALGQLREARYGPVFLGALREETDPVVRAKLLEAAGRTGDVRILDDLLDLELREGDEPARTLALARLGIDGLTTPETVGHLVQTLSHPDAEARLNAAYFFGRSGAPGPWAGRAGSVRAQLDSLPPSRPMAMHLLMGLSLLGDPQDTPRFLWWLGSSPDWRVRANAARALGGRTANPRVRQGLLRALEEPSTHVAIYAANALSSVDQLAPGEKAELKAWVEEHPDQWLRAGPILALLGRQGEGPFLREWLSQWSEDDIGPRTRGLGALAFVPGSEATETLLEASRSPNSRILGTALGGLARRWRVDRQDPAQLRIYFEAFADGLRTGDPSAVFVAAPALADSAFLPLGSQDLLVEIYGEMTLPEGLEGMQAILRALGELGSPEAEAFLETQQEVQVKGIRDVATEALAQIRGEELEAEGEVAPPERTVDWTALAELGVRPRLVLETEKGTVSLALDAESAPLTVQTITGFAREGLYDGVPFHRVVPNFVAQGGDFARQDGFGGPGFTIRSEFTQIPYDRGVMGMASAGKDTEGSQFFITHSMQPHLEGSYTAFGWVVDGMNALDAIEQEDRILAARVEPGS